ncbi:MAG: hypothetical protein ABW217_12965 [Polyangiaceae bacterium]
MRSSRLCVLLVAVQATGCVTEDADPAAGGTSSTGGSGVSAGSGGSAGTAGAGAGAGGSGGGSGGGLRDDPAFGVAIECPAILQASITDFTPVALSADAGAADAGTATVIPGVTFGDFTATWSGGTYVYPNAADDPYVLSSDMSSGEWHMSGNIGTYTGFGLYFSNCTRIDASAFAGISFTIRGNVAMGGAITLQVSTSEDEISHLWLNSQPAPPSPAATANSGRCLPAMNQYDGTCAIPTFSVPITPSATTIEVRWADLTGGSPSASVNPSEITGISWILPNPPGAGTATPTPYAAELYVDDLSFIPAD